ncbi:MAG TPA: glycoside hydrolase domain-containing protein [Verrucomicrobiae bacterium]
MTKISSCVVIALATWTAAAAENPSATAANPAASKTGSSRSQKLACFTFGTPASATRAGFAKVTIKDLFTAEKGYGFLSGEGLLEFDRGGSEIVLPKDEYTARTYGAYRTTSDLTCALIEGTTNNTFQVALPDGDYTVWVIASDAEWDPPLFEVWANGQKKLDVRIPRARFVFVESFRARAVEGRLRIELKGPHGWILSGLVIGTEGPELAGVVAKMERDIFFLTEPELPNWKEVKPAPANPPLEWTAAERQKGYIVFPADYTEQIVPGFVPDRAAIRKPLTAFVTPGEFEPATVCVSAGVDLGKVNLELSDFVGEKGSRKIARESVTAGIVRCWPQRESSWGTKGDYRVVPEMIEPPDSRGSRVEAGQVRQWWLTVRVPPETPAERYRMSLTLRPEKAPPTTLEWRLLVLPFQLERPADRHWGTWLESFPPVGGLRGPARRGRNTPAEMERLVRADLADYRDHGFDSAIFNFYFGVKENPDGSFAYDISALARDLDYWKTLGATTPVAIGCEYTFRNLEYGLAEPGEKHVPGTFSPKARKAIVGLVRHIHDEAARRGWPKIYFYPIDEPGNNKTENRMLFAQNVLDLVHEVPGCQTATTLTASDVQRLGERVDVRIYAYGHYSRGKVIKEAQQGHPFWWYANGMFYGQSTIASRGMAGFEFLRSGAEVASAWGFDATKDNPFNDFDGGHKDWNVIFPGVDAPIPTIYWELCREGVDDCRYVATLQQHIRRAREQGKAKAAERAEAVLAPLIDPDAPPIENTLAFGRYRWRIAREILNLLGDRTLALTFPAAVETSATPEKTGPNLIVDPSFEAGPQADGFPVPSFHIADPYAKAEEKPIGALAVTDEVAHSGRYCLKWDFGKMNGKGAIYDGKRYLIVNVQVPTEAARKLRGQRVKVGYWFRLQGGAAVPGMTLRQFGRNEFLGGISYTGGVDDPAVWNHFEAEDRLRADFEGLDIHISCPAPDDADVAAQSVFYIDDVSLQAVEEPPLAVTTPLDEYYIGEAIPWTVTAAFPAKQVKLQLLGSDRVIAEQTGAVENAPLRGTFPTGELKPGIYTLRASLSATPDAEPTARCQVILAPAVFDF